FKDFSACVFVDGVEVEYFEARTKWDDSEEGQEVMHAYIVGEPGKTFTISWKDHRGTKASSGHIFIDGKDVASAIMRIGRGKPVSRSGAKVSADKLRPFQFANLNITSDDRLADKKKDKERLKEMSTIRLEIAYVQVGPLVPFKNQEVHDWGHVHEEAKALGLMTEYAPKIAIPASRAVATRRLDPSKDGPDVQFIFTYATREHLMAADIIPNPRAPKITKGANIQDALVIEGDRDEPNNKRVSIPRSPSKRNRGKSNTWVGSDEDDEDEPDTTKRPKINGSAPGSSTNGASPTLATLPRAGTEDDLEELQHQLDKYNLERSQESDGDESHVETAVQLNNDDGDESQDL
ncbi:Peptidyl-prolyl cis-trans isomerase, partial [Rhizoctonia solani]